MWILKINLSDNDERRCLIVWLLQCSFRRVSLRDGKKTGNDIKSGPISKDLTHPNDGPPIRLASRPGDTFAVIDLALISSNEVPRTKFVALN